jgi:hypothetical protein
MFFFSFKLFFSINFFFIKKKKKKKNRGNPRIELGTSLTLTKNHTTRPITLNERNANNQESIFNRIKKKKKCKMNYN